jgi:hypothetical protein
VARHTRPRWVADLGVAIAVTEPHSVFCIIVLIQ